MEPSGRREAFSSVASLPQKQPRLILIITLAISIPILFILFFTLGVESVLRNQLFQDQVDQIYKDGHEWCNRLDQTIRSLERRVLSFARLLESRMELPATEWEIAEFDRLVQAMPDGSWRSRREVYSPTSEAGIFIPQYVKVNNRLKTFFYRSWRTTTSYGSGALDEPISDTWVLPAKGGITILWPQEPEFIYEARPDQDYSSTEWLTLTRPETNPKGHACWTSPSFDPVPKEWLISVVAPFQVDGQWGGAVGHDIQLQEFIRNASPLTRIEGSHIALITPGGLLLVSDYLQWNIDQSGGRLPINQISDEPYRNLLQAVMKQPITGQEGQPRIEEVNGHMVLIGRSHNPDWIFVNNIPKESITARLSWPFRWLRIIVLASWVVSILGVIGFILRDRYRNLAYQRVLQASQERLEMALWGGNLGLWDLDILSGKRVVNQRYAEMLGYSVKEVEETPGFWEERLHPEDRERVLAAIQENLTGRTETLQQEYRVRHRDGTWRWIQDTGRIVLRDREGRPLRASGVHQDITERKQVELELQEQQASDRDFSSRLSILHEVSMELSLCETLDEVCKRAVELGRERLGFDRIGIWFATDDPKRMRGSFGTDENGSLRDERSSVVQVADDWADLFNEGSPLILTNEKELFDEHRKVVGIGTHAFAGMWDGQKVIGGVATDNFLSHRPITPRDGELLVLFAKTLGHLCTLKQAQEERHRLEQQLQHTQKLESLGVLAGGIAHDFNNLLMAIMGNADLALNILPVSSPVLVNLAEIEGAARRAADLTRQMLAYSGKGQFLIEEINLNEVVIEMGNLLEASISKRAHLIYNLANDLPAIQADVTQIRQVVMNLIMNASEAIGEQEGFIRITTGSTRLCQERYSRFFFGDTLTDENYVFLDVSDTGCGMDEETISRIFDPFFTTKFTGRGLGLAAVLGIIRGHKGAIQIQSQKGHGSTFRLLIPSLDRSVTQTKTDRAEIPHIPAGTTVLLVDDEEIVRTTGEFMLNHMGCVVISAANGRDALEKVIQSNLSIHCVLLDLTMPYMDGVETLREIKRIRGDLAVIVMSGYTETDTLERFPEIPPDGFIQKPFILDSLRKAVLSVLSPST